jgi:hypothetical protein
MPEITLAAILFTIGFNVVGLYLLSRQQVAPAVDPTAKKRMPMSTIAYMVIGVNMLVFLYVWIEVVQSYVIPRNLPMSLALGIFGGSILAWWTTKNLPTQCAEGSNLFKKNASLHRLYGIETLSVLGGQLTVIATSMTIPVAVMILSAAILSLCIHIPLGKWKYRIFPITYSAIWMSINLLILDFFGSLIAVLLSYAMVRALISRKALSIDATT